jgi:hypothetical protein
MNLNVVTAVTNEDIQAKSFYLNSDLSAYKAHTVINHI